MSRPTCCSRRAGVRKEFGGLVAVEDVDFVVPRGSITSLIGPNGAGKTTFFNMLTGAYTPTAGEIVFDGQDIAGLPQHKITALGIGRTFQNIRLFGTMTSLENTLVGMHCRMHARRLPQHRALAAAAPRGGGGAREGARAAGLLRAAEARRARVRAQPRLRRPAAARGGARARDRARSCCCSTSRPPA